MAMRFAARAAKLSPWGAGDTVIVIAFVRNTFFCVVISLFFWAD